MEDKITIKIGKKLAGYHLDRLYAELFPELEGRIKKKNFDAEDLDEMLWKRRMVFPQNYGSLGYSESLPVTILYWMPFVIAGYQKLINDSAKDPYVQKKNTIQNFSPTSSGRFNIFPLSLGDLNFACFQ